MYHDKTIQNPIYKDIYETKEWLRKPESGLRNRMCLRESHYVPNDTIYLDFSTDVRGSEYFAFNNHSSSGILTLHHYPPVSSTLHKLPASIVEFKEKLDY